MSLQSVSFIIFCIILLSQNIAANDSSSGGLTCSSLTSSNLCVQLGSKFYLINDVDKLNWFEAQRFCRRSNTNLATIENAHERRLLSDYLISKGYKVDWHKGGRGFYISGTDLGQQPGTFFSIANGNLLPYTAWTAGQPDNAGGTEHCVHFWYKSGDSFGMNDLPCSVAQNFICEFKDHLINETQKYATCDTVANVW